MNMYYGDYAPWEHYPKTLRDSEISKPLSVIADFFSSGRPKEHIKDLKAWRTCVVNDQFFKDKRHGPGTLLFIHELNLRLLEGSYLLLLKYRNSWYNKEKATEAQLDSERETWVYFPNNLSDAELLNPYKTIKKIFKKIPPQKYRDYLNEWLHAALYTKAIDESMETGEIFVVYENMRKLYSAAWIIYQRETINTELKDTPNVVDKTPPVNKVFEIKGISPKSTAGEQSGLNHIRKFITKRFPCVDCIIHLGTRHHPFTYYLLILINDAEKTPEGEISNKIEDHCRFLTNVYAIVHKSASAISALDAGQRFWSTAFTNGESLYRSTGLMLPEPQTVSDFLVIDRANFHWNRWGVQAENFLAGAEFYKEKKAYRLAAFLLHQTVESTLKAIIQAILGYRVQTHNLSRLLRLSLLITDDLKDILGLDTTNGIQQFSLLQDAYSNSRYSNAFDPEENAVGELIATVTTLYDTAVKIKEQFIMQNNNNK